MSTSLNSLKSLQVTLAEPLHQVDQIIEQQITHRLTLISDVCRHLIFAGGKRIRPLLTLACGQLAGEINLRTMTLAATVEFMHTATLLHDDVLDDSVLRRGQETAKVRWGNAISILVGDFLFTQAFQLMVKDGDLKILELLSQAAQHIVEGELTQIQIGDDLNVTIDELLQVTGAKTAALFGASCQAGALTAGQQNQDFYNFGYALGMAFQLVDDVLDYTAMNRGKTQGDDFHAGKITLPVVLAYQHGSPDEKMFWERIFTNHKSTSEDFATALTMIQPYLKKTLTQAQGYATQAIQILETLSAHPLKETLAYFVNQICEVDLTS